MKRERDGWRSISKNFTPKLAWGDGIKHGVFVLAAPERDVEE